MTTAIIRHLQIHRFRGVRSLNWTPHPQLNVVLGAADGGKSTILEAIALLFSPAPNYGLSEFDYHDRNLEMGFSIQAVLSFTDIDIMRDEGFPAPPMQGWLDGKLTDLPDEAGAEAVLVCRLTGTPDQETRYEVVGAGGEIRAPFSRAMRRRIGLARLGVADRGDRDIRLVQGGALDRYLQGQEVRQTVLQAVMKTPLHDQLEAGPKTALKAISDGFKTRNLPNPVRLGLVGTPGVSLAASVGLTVGEDDPSSLPLSAWGTGTRRLAALEISTLGASAETIAVIDEPETGLEPYRQRVFIRDLAARGQQAFVTTHAPAVLAQAAKHTSQSWRIGAPTSPDASEGVAGDHGEAPTPDFMRCLWSSVRSSMPSLRRKPRLCSRSCRWFAKAPPKLASPHASLNTGSGTASPAEASTVLTPAATSRRSQSARPCSRPAFRWRRWSTTREKRAAAGLRSPHRQRFFAGTTAPASSSAVLSAMPDLSLQEVHIWAEQVMHRRADHQAAEIRRELKVDRGPAVAELFQQAGREAFLAALLAAACPKAEGGKKPRGWFKTFDGGYLLADKLLALTSAPTLMTKVGAFLTAIENATAS